MSCRHTRATTSTPCYYCGLERQLSSANDRIKIAEETEKGLRLVIKTIADELGVTEPRCKYIMLEISNLNDRIKELETRLEISPDHNIDGIGARDASIALLDVRIKELEKELALATAHTVYVRHGKQLQGVEGVLDELDSSKKTIKTLRDTLKRAAKKLDDHTGDTFYGDMFRELAKK